MGASPGEHFALDQQQFVKSIILITEHTEKGDVGLLLNRPTRLTTEDLGFGKPAWKVWFGGGSEGDMRVELQKTLKLVCIHGLERLALSSKKIFKGIFVVDFNEAKKAVEAGVAQRGDFITFVGSCHWPAGQLQHELDGLTESGKKDRKWTLASTSKEALLECLRVYQDVIEFRENEGEMDYGISKWQRLYELLGGEFAASVAVASEIQVDDILKRWTDRNLVEPLGYD